MESEDCAGVVGAFTEYRDIGCIETVGVYIYIETLGVYIWRTPLPNHLLQDSTRTLNPLSVSDSSETPLLINPLCLAVRPSVCPSVCLSVFLFCSLCLS